MKPGTVGKPSGAAAVAAGVAVLAPVALLGFVVAGMAASFRDSDFAQRLLVPLAATFAVSSLVAVALGYLVRRRARANGNESDTQIAGLALVVGWICVFLAIVVAGSGF